MRRVIDNMAGGDETFPESALFFFSGRVHHILLESFQCLVAPLPDIKKNSWNLSNIFWRSFHPLLLSGADR